MDLNTDYLRSIETREQQELLKAELERLGLISTNSNYTEAQLQDLATINSVTIEETNLNIASKNAFPQIELTKEKSNFNPDYSESKLLIDGLSKLQAIKTITLDGYASRASTDFAYADLAMGEYLHYSYQALSQLENEYFGLDPANSAEIYHLRTIRIQQIFSRIEKDLEEMEELRQKKRKEIEEKRIHKYIEDFKFMLKAFDPNSSSFQATQTLISAYKQLLAYF